MDNCQRKKAQSATCKFLLSKLSFSPARTAIPSLAAAFHFGRNYKYGNRRFLVAFLEAAPRTFSEPATPTDDENIILTILSGSSRISRGAFLVLAPRNISPPTIQISVPRNTYFPILVCVRGESLSEQPFRNAIDLQKQLTRGDRYTTI